MRGSQIGHETQELNASHDSYETQVEHASHEAHETQAVNASHPLNETHEAYASQGADETHTVNASQRVYEPQHRYASHEDYETQLPDASQCAHEPHIRHASHEAYETHTVNASQEVNEPHMIDASQTADETQADHASHHRHETHSLDASQVHHEPHAPDASQRNHEPHVKDATQKEDNVSQEEHTHDAEVAALEAEGRKVPEMRPRKRPHMLQQWLWWREVMKMRQKHVLRLSAIERGKSNLEAVTEAQFIEWLTTMKDNAEAELVRQGRDVGPVFDWLVSHKGLGMTTLKDGTWRSGGSLASQLLAQIDDIGMFATVSKLWRWCGYAVIDGKAEHYAPGVKAHYSRILKSTCYLVAKQFMLAQTSPYTEIYYEEKARQRELHPITECRECGIPWDDCTQHDKGNHRMRFNDGHLHNRAWRKMIKVFLCHLWLYWRRSEGLPVSDPYIFDIGGHSREHMIEAPVLVAAE